MQMRMCGTAIYLKRNSRGWQKDSVDGRDRVET